MSTARNVSVTATGGALAVSVLFACATNVELGEQDIPQPDATSPATQTDAGEPDADVVPDAAPDAGFDGMVPGTCSTGDFCYASLPLQAPLSGVSGSAADDVWAAGGRGILRFRGTSWEQVYEFTGTITTVNPNPFLGVAAHNPQKVWAWALDSTGRIFFVRYMSVGDAPQAFHESATTVAFNFRRSVWVTPDADAAWVTAGNANITRFTDNGSGGLVAQTLTPKASPTDTKRYYWQHIWGFAADDVYVSGEDFSADGAFPSGNQSPPLLAHWDGADWTISALPVPVGPLSGMLRGTQPGGTERRLWIRTVEGQTSTVSLYPIGQDGSVGEALLRQNTHEGSPCGLDYGWVISPTSAWISNGLSVCRWDGTKLSYVPTALGHLPTGFVRGIWGASDDDIWIVGEAPPKGDTAPATGFAARRKK